MIYLYLRDKIQLQDIKGGINEVYQIGFRLGKKSKGAKIRAIDYPGAWLGSYADLIADTLNLNYYLEDQKKRALEVKERSKIFNTNTIRENLIYTNQLEQLRNNHSYYNNIAIKVKDTVNVMFSYQENEQEIDGLPYLMRSYDFNNIGVDLVAEWYKRNLFIYRNILEETESNDRILALFGSGHIHYLNQLIGDNDQYKLQVANEFLSEK